MNLCLDWYSKSIPVIQSEGKVGKRGGGGGA